MRLVSAGQHAKAPPPVPRPDLLARSPGVTLVIGGRRKSQSAPAAARLEGMDSSRVIAIVDFGVGNLRSVAKALEADGFEAEITTDPGTLASAAGVILPGDGNFGAVMEAIHESGLLDATLDAVRGGKPFLGICVGYQMMLELSEESPGVSGLGLIPGTVRRFPTDSGLKIPHMGWNSLEQISACPLLEDVAEGDMVYFVHSFYPCPVSGDGGAAWTEYGVRFPSVYCRDNLMATQFHPEKSGTVGRGIMRAFGRLCRC